MIQCFLGKASATKNVHFQNSEFLERSIAASAPSDFVLLLRPVHLMQCEVDIGAMCMAYNLIDVLTLKMIVLLFH